MTTIRNTAYLIFARYSTLPLNIATGILMARVLGPVELGKYALMIWLPAVLAGPMSLGIGNANLYFGARDKSLGRPLVANSLAISVTISLIVFGGFYLVLRAFHDKLPLGLTPNYLLIPLLDIPFRLMIMFASNLFNAWEDHRIYRNIEILQAIVYFLSCFTVVFVFDMALWGFIYSQILSSFVVCLYALAVLAKRHELSLRCDGKLLGKSVTYGMKIQFGSVIRVGGQKLDELILLYFSGAKALGFLTVARNLTNRLRVIPYSLGNVIAPKLAHGGNDSSILAAKSVRIIVIVMTLATLSLIIMVGPLVPLIYGQAYSDAVTSVRILLLTLVPLSVQRILITYLLAHGRPDIFIKSVIFSAMIIILLDVILIPSIGLNGAVIASLIAITFEAGYVSMVFVRQSGTGWGDIFMPTHQDAVMFSNLLHHIKTKLSGRGK